MNFRIGSVSIQGPRERNDDRGVALQGVLMGHPFALLGVCDGMGSSDGGDRAASEVAAALAGFLAYLPPSLSDSDQDFRKDLIRQAIGHLHEGILSRLGDLADQSKQHTMATTLAACFGWEETLAVWWLGDSRVYRFRDGRLERLTHDHSVVEETLRLSEEQALEHPARSQITRFVRAGVNWAPDTVFSNCLDGDVILVVSDGISASCRTWELETILTYCLSARISPELLARYVMKHLGDNLGDNATMSVAFCGIPKPYAQATATLELTTLAERGLRQDLVDMLSRPRRSLSPQGGAVRPAWRSLYPAVMRDLKEAAEFRVAGKRVSVLSQDGANCVCLECGALFGERSGCPIHSFAHLWRGAYLQVIAQSGEMRYYPIRVQDFYVGRDGCPGSDVPLSEDEAVSPAHTRFTMTKDGHIDVSDMNSDNGTWLRFDRLVLPADLSVQDGTVLRIGDHQIILRTTDRQAFGSATRQKIVSIQGGR